MSIEFRVYQDDNIAVKSEYLAIRKTDVKGCYEVFDSLTKQKTLMTINYESLKCFLDEFKMAIKDFCPKCGTELRIACGKDSFKQGEELPESYRGRTCFNYCPECEKG